MIQYKPFGHVALTLMAAFALALTTGCPSSRGGGGGGDPVCGDGTVGVGEQCDDGNTASGDGCDGNCQIESAGPVCGDGTVDQGEECDDGNTVSGDGCDDICQNELPSTLFVVNNGSALTSYAGAGALDGEIAPTTRLNLGSATSLFRPRSVVVDREGRLLVSREGGGIVGYDSATTADGDKPADIVVDGNNTNLESPISFAYDAENDRLFVGNVNAKEAGILVFDNVSTVGFNGDIAPDRTFGPPDRVPFTTESISISMTVDAMDLDSAGNLYVSDTSGLNGNQSRILVFADPGSAEGLQEPVRTFSSTSWGNVEDIVVDDNDVFYVVDGGDSVRIFQDADTLDGDDEPPTFIVTVQLDRVGLEGVVVGSDGTGYLADRQNHAVYSYDDLAQLSGALVPDRALEGSETRLSSPRQMFLLEP